MRPRPLPLRFAYWFGAALDGVMVVPLCFPPVAGAMLGVVGFAPGPDYRYAAYVAASLMAGWTALLVWGAREPIARRGVLLLTALPVVVGLAAAGGYAVVVGLVRMPFMAPVLVVQALVCAILVSSYARARRLARGLDTRGGSQVH
jgi:hypothetical protein